MPHCFTNKTLSTKLNLKCIKSVPVATEKGQLVRDSLLCSFKLAPQQ